LHPAGARVLHKCDAYIWHMTRGTEAMPVTPDTGLPQNGRLVAKTQKFTLGHLPASCICTSASTTRGTGNVGRCSGHAHDSSPAGVAPDSKVPLVTRVTPIASRVHTPEDHSDSCIPRNNDRFEWRESTICSNRITPIGAVMPFAIRTLSALLWLVAAGSSLASDAYVGASISGQVAPGVYGRIDIGNAAPPPVVYVKPVVAVRTPSYSGGPVYLHVPPGHAKNWSKHCHKYNACAQPVYFVKSAEYEPARKNKK
jgi:hypothetical protein